MIEQPFPQFKKEELKEFRSKIQDPQQAKEIINQEIDKPKEIIQPPSSNEKHEEDKEKPKEKPAEVQLEVQLEKQEDVNHIAI